MRPTSRWPVVLFATVLVACAPASRGAAPEAACEVTVAPAPAFVPPVPFPAQPPAEYTDQFWYGTADLWTMLLREGVWGGLPQSQGGYVQKVFWWSAEYSPADEPVPDLTVSGRRLDGPSDAVVFSPATNASADFGTAMLVGVTIPTSGCWEITGHYRGHDLSFVVKVVP